MKTLSANDHENVSAAIRRAEADTSGEIFCVFARSSGSYFYPAAFLLALAMLVIALAVAILLDARWYQPRLPFFVAAQCLAYGSALLILWLAPQAALWLVPRRIRYRQAHDNALRQFMARNVHVTEGRTGVLIFLSMAERYAVVVADAGINAKVAQETWDGVVALLIEGARRGRPADGFVAAVTAVGGVLAKHFPIGRGDSNELDDHLVEL